MEMYGMYTIIFIFKIASCAFSSTYPTNNSFDESSIEMNNSSNNGSLLGDFDCDEENVFIYDSHEYEIFHNKSALVYGDIIPNTEYFLDGDTLLVCIDNDSLSDEFNKTVEGNMTEILPKISSELYTAQIYICGIGSVISIIALIVHIIIFYHVPSLRNLPGYNLTALSLAFLFAYTFILVGQVPQVVGIPCVASGALQYFFFFTAFFCMNVMAFDVWKTLRLTINNLAVMENNMRQFMWYTIYAWGCPCITTIILLIMDNSDAVPDYIKPQFGKRDVCWMVNYNAQKIFFVFPALILFILNGFFFITSALIISHNTMRCRNDSQKQTAHFNYFLYLKLGFMMGVTWFMSILGLMTNNEVIWIIHDLFNVLQGLILFLLFTCSNRVIKYIRENSKFSFSDSRVVSTASRIDYS